LDCSLDEEGFVRVALQPEHSTHVEEANALYQPLFPEKS